MKIDTRLEELGDRLERSVAAELRTKQRAAGAAATWARRARPRLLAGSTLGLAGVGAALLLILSAGGAAAPPAFAITANGDGSLAVNLDSAAGLVGVNRKLAAMGTNEHISFQMAQGPAAASGAVDCVPAPRGASVSGPAVTVTVGPGDTNTEIIAAGNTGAGTWHVAACWRFDGTDTATIPASPGALTSPGPLTASGAAANTGNSGAG
jgi:hypothetical protein